MIVLTKNDDELTWIVFRKSTLGYAFSLAFIQSIRVFCTEEMCRYKNDKGCRQNICQVIIVNDTEIDRWDSKYKRGKKLTLHGVRSLFGMSSASESPSDSRLILPIPRVRQERGILHGASSTLFPRGALGVRWWWRVRIYLPWPRDRWCVTRLKPRCESAWGPWRGSFFPPPDVFYFCLRKVRFRLVLSLRYAPLLAPPPFCRRRTPSSSRRDETGISLGKCASPWLSSATLCGMFLHRRRSLLVARRLLATCMRGASVARGK